MNGPLILYLIDTLNTGGAERSLLDIISSFKRYRVIVCHIYPGSALKAEFESRGIEVISLNIPPPYHWRQAEHALKEVIKIRKPSVIHSTLFKSDIVSRRVASTFGIPLVNSLVNNSYHESRFRNSGVRMNIKLKGIQWLDAWTSRKVDIFISNSETIRQSNSKALHVPLDKIKVIYRGRTEEDFTVDHERIKELRNELGISGKKIGLLNVSRLIDRKGQLELIRAFREILNDFPESILFIAGEGPHRARLQEEIEKLDLGRHVKMLGTRRDVPLLMKAADCFIFPSHYEGLPGVIIEAMFARIPIVASDIPENLECVDRESAFLFKVGDVREMAAAVKKALENESDRLQKSTKAFEIAREKFAIKKIAGEYEVLYDNLTNLNGIS